MADTKMLQAIVSGQSALKEELLTKLNKLEKKIDDVKDVVDENSKRLDRVIVRLDDLEEDAPTVEEFDKLGQRVQKLEDLQLAG